MDPKAEGTGSASAHAAGEKKIMERPHLSPSHAHREPNVVNGTGRRRGSIAGTPAHIRQRLNSVTQAEVAHTFLARDSYNPEVKRDTTLPLRSATHTAAALTARWSQEAGGEAGEGIRPICVAACQANGTLEREEAEH